MAKKGLLRAEAERIHTENRSKVVNEAISTGDLSMITESEFMNMSPEDSNNVHANGSGCFGAETTSTARVWALDSGASSHLVNKEDHQSIIREAEAYAELETVKGPVIIKEGAVVDIPQIDGAQPALMLEGTPNCASMGRLIDDMEYGIMWFQGDCKWFDPHGNVLQLDRYDYVPVLEDLGVQRQMACVMSNPQVPLF